MEAAVAGPDARVEDGGGSCGRGLAAVDNAVEEEEGASEIGVPVLVLVLPVARDSCTPHPPPPPPLSPPIASRVRPLLFLLLPRAVDVAALVRWCTYWATVAPTIPSALYAHR